MGWLDCVVDDVYLPRNFAWADLDEWTPDPVIEKLPVLLGMMPPGVAAWLSGLQFTAAPIQIHAVVMALFASVIAPFGA